MRRFIGMTMTIGLVLGLFAGNSGSASAATGPVFTVMNTSETPPDGVWFRNSPHTGDTDRVTGHGVYRNERVRLQCYAWGDSVGAYNDTLWYYTLNVTRTVNAGVSNQGYLNAHYIDDGKVANQVDASVPQCGGAPAPLPAGGSVYFQPKWSTGDPYPLDRTLTISKEKWSNSVPVARTKADCPTNKVDRYVPATRNGQRVTTMGAWSVGRLAPVYMIEHNFDRARQFNFIVLYDPGSYANYFDPDGCDRFFNESADLARWLGDSTKNVLMILAGHDTYDPNLLGHGSHQGIQQKLFPSIRGKAIAQQVYVCNYNTMIHPDVLRNFRNVMADGQTKKCPRGVQAWHP